MATNQDGNEPDHSRHENTSGAIICELNRVFCDDDYRLSFAVRPAQIRFWSPGEMRRTIMSKKFGIMCATLLTAAVLSVMPVSLQRSATSGVVVSVNQAQAYYGHYRRVTRRVYRRHYRVYRRHYRRAVRRYYY